MNSGIYYLVARNPQNNDKIRIELTDKQEDRYCSTLSYIDSLTTKFVNKKQLVDRLYTNGYINFQNADLYIEYNHNGLKFEEVIFKNLEGYTLLTPDTESTIDINNPTLIIGVNHYLDRLNNRHFRNYVLSSSKVNNKFKEHVEKYFQELYLNTAEFNKQKILEDFTNYKLFRDFNYLIDSYDNPQYAASIEAVEQIRQSANLLDFKPIKQEEKQMEFSINNNEVQLPNSNQVVTQTELEKTIQEHNEEKEEFLTEDDWNQNYYPYNVKKLNQ